jgi:hypothetical protein
MLFRASPYDHTLMFDGDLLFQSPIDELFAQTRDKGFLVTQFSTWATNGRKMHARIMKFQPHLTPERWAEVQAVPAVNIGVMGWSRGNPVIDEWERLTMAVAGVHMADEHACQVSFMTGSHVVMPAKWNESCVYATVPLPEAKILHYHGNKHTSPKRNSSRLWLNALREMIFNGGVSSKIALYLNWGDVSTKSVLEQHPGILDAFTEFKP